MRISDWSSDVCSSDLTGTYGSIDRASVANWRTSTFDIPEGDVAGYTTWDSTTARPIIEQISLMRSRNGRYADLLIADANSYQPISASFVAHQRIVSERLGRIGFSGLRSEERRVGKEWFRTCRSRGAPEH